MSLNDVHGFNAMLARVASDFNELKLHIRRTDTKTIVTAKSGDLMGIGYSNASTDVGTAARAALADLGVRLNARDTEMAQVMEQRRLIAQEREELSRKRAELISGREKVAAIEALIVELGRGLAYLNAVAFSKRLILISDKRAELVALQARLAGTEAEIDNFDDVDLVDDDDGDDDWC